MNSLLEKLKKTDKKILSGIGLGGVLAVVVIVGLIMVGNNKSADDNGKQNSVEVNHEVETENQDTENQTKKEDEKESENQTQDSDNSNDSEKTVPESSDDSNIKNEQSDKDSESKAEEKPSTSEPKPSNEQKPSEDNKKDESDKSDDSEEAPVTETYTVNVYSAGGHRLYNVKVNVYADSSMTNLVSSASTNSSGKATLKLVPSNNYVFSLSNVAEGYQLKDNYSFSGKTTTIILTSSVILNKDILTTKLKVGDVMYDFSVTNAKGNTVTLSELLKTKRMVMLNFWYVNCEFCVAEFPAMSSAYRRYSKVVEIVALNPYDDMNTVKDFLNENLLNFQVATCPYALPDVFGVKAYPVSVIIDSYGVIREIENGAILEEQGFVNLFNKYI